MKIWIVNQYAIPPSQPGGTRHFSIAREWINRGHEVVLVASSFDHIIQRETRLRPDQSSALEVIDGVPFLWLRTPPYRGNTAARLLNMLAFSARLLRGRVLKRLFSPDVIVGSSPHLFGAWAACHCARHRRIPFVLEVRDIWPESLVQLGRISTWHPLILWLAYLERTLYRKADSIWQLMPNAADHIVQHGGSRQKIVWAPNGIDMNLAPAATPPLPTPGLFSLVYAGGLTLAYGLDNLLDAVTLLNHQGMQSRFQVRLVGDGPLKPRLTERVRREGIANVVFEPPVPKARIFEILQRADALVATNQKKTLYRHGVSYNKLYDYMAAARPILFWADSSNNPVQDAGAGFSVPAGDMPGFVEAVSKLVQLSAEERWQMGLQGRRYVEQYHSLNRLAVKLESVLSHLTVS